MRSDEHRWIQRYGFEEVTVGKPDDDAVEDGRNSRRRKYRKVVRERPGLVPSALFHIISNTVFLRLADVASGLPDYTEQILLSSMDSEPDSTGYSQRTAYNTVFEELKKELAAALKSGSKRLLATYLQTLLAYPDGCTRGETVFDPRSGDVIVQVSPLSHEKLYPKEQALIDLVAAERLEGRRVLVYVTHTGTRDITGRMDDILTRHGLRLAMMKADAVAPNRREKWVADKVKQGIDVLICHPRLVQTGLDLIDFPTTIWGETDYSVYVARQASRRSWRIGQTRPVKVVFMSYRNTLQADALKLVAKKMQSSLAVEGELPEDGLAAYRRRRGRHDDGPGQQDRQRRRGRDRRRDDGGGVRGGAGRRDRGRRAAGGRGLEAGGDRAGGRRSERERAPRGYPYRADVGACAGQRSPRQRPAPCWIRGERPRAHPGQQPAPYWIRGQRNQRLPRRRGPGAAAVALLLGGVHGRGSGQAEAPGQQTPARDPLDVRVGAYP